MFNKLFETLDLNKDELLSRTELHAAAKRLEWHWPEAPIFALLDLLTVIGPISRSTFVNYMQQVSEDPLGPYGKILLKAPSFSIPSITKKETYHNDKQPHLKNLYGQEQAEIEYTDGILLLERFAGSKVASDYQRLLSSLEVLHLSTDVAGFLIIDPQRSFTKGAWMRSIGANADVDIKPIESAFNNCCKLLKKVYGNIDTMFTRCPFPPDSYDWHDPLVEVIDESQRYFIKPGNSVMFPPTNGFQRWVERCFDGPKTTLVLGGCTLNSCLRVSSMETFRFFKNRSLQVVVDLSLSGARLRNFKNSSNHGGRSAVESAIHQMMDAGVQVVRHVNWT